uniref:TTR protein n=1 Tax=Homo sapiens TaxID=9606 RepID=V9GZJ0_HUMAN|nr:ORF3 [Homo sapiens]
MLLLRISLLVIHKNILFFFMLENAKNRRVGESLGLETGDLPSYYGSIRM